MAESMSEQIFSIACALSKADESEEGIGYLAKKYHFSNGKVVMPAEAMEDITDLLN